FFFFQAEDGIRDRTVTGVQTCALPIFGRVEAAVLVGRGQAVRPAVALRDGADDRAGRRVAEDVVVVVVEVAGHTVHRHGRGAAEIGRASCRERGERSGGGGAFRTTRGG